MEVARDGLSRRGRLLRSSTADRHPPTGRVAFLRRQSGLGQFRQKQTTHPPPVHRTLRAGVQEAEERGEDFCVSERSLIPSPKELNDPRFPPPSPCVRFVDQRHLPRHLADREPAAFGGFWGSAIERQADPDPCFAILTSKMFDSSCPRRWAEQPPARAGARGLATQSAGARKPVLAIAKARSNRVCSAA